MEDRTSKRNDNIRRYEAAIVVLLTLPLWLVTCWSAPSVPSVSIPAGLLAESVGGMWLLTACALVAIFILVLTWLCVQVVDTTIAIVLFVIAICMGITMIQTKVLPDFRRFTRKEQTFPNGFDLHKKVEPRGTLHMDLLDSIHVEKFSLEDVPLGKLPCEVSVAKLRRLLPDFLDSLEKQQSRVNSNQGSPFEVSLELNEVERVDARVFSVIKDGEFHLSFLISSEDMDAQIKDLIDRARMDNYETSPAWCEAFLRFGRHGWVALKEKVREEPKISELLDDLAMHRYGIVENMPSEKVWDVLMEICDEAKEERCYFSSSWPRADSIMPEVAFGCSGRAVKQLARLLDHQQVADALTAAVKRGQWPKVRHNEDEIFPIYSPIRRVDESGFPELMPLVHAAWEIERTLSQQDPENYNLIERHVGDALFSHTPPQAKLYHYFDLARMLEDREKQENNPLGSWLFSGFISKPDFSSPIFNSPLADEYVLRHWRAKGAKIVSHTFGDNHLVSKAAVQTGLSLRASDGAQFGSVKINHWYKMLIEMDSPMGRSFRRTHRKELLKLAIRSIGPIEKKAKKIKDDAASQAKGALSAIFSSNQGSRNQQWPILAHLEFLMLDAPGTEEEPSLAMEFWPYLDAMIDTFPKLRGRERLRLRWNYLARIWPESDVESFVAAYSKTPSRERQEVFNDIHLRGPGLPETLPMDTRLKILRRLQEELEKLPWEEKQEYVFFYSQDGLTITEEQTVLRATGKLDSPEGAKTYLKIHKEYFERHFESLGPSPPKEEVEKLLRSVYEHRYPYRFARDDRVDLLAKHEDANLRRIAVAMIRYAPKPRYVKLLPELTEDDDPMVKAEAIAVKKELDRILEGELPSRTLGKSAQTQK